MQTLPLNLGLGLVLVLSAAAAPAQKAARPKRPAAPMASPLNLPGEVNDFRTEDELDLAAEQLMAAGKVTKMSELIRQMGRRNCSVELPRFSPKNASGAQIAAGCRAGVVAIGDLSKCKKCPKWHVGSSSGFLLTESGVCVTCYHVVHVPESPTLIAMTGDGRIVAVKEVLAANPHTDLAILQLDGTGFKPLPLDTNAPVGSTVRVLSHPDDHFFTLSEGIVSRYVALPLEKAAGEVTFMAITADFGAGSSGAPVFNEQGGVVGLVNNTQSLYYDPKKAKDLQMVFKHCLPSQYILQILEKK
jgi:serine protease Do